MRVLPAHAHNRIASFARFTEQMARFHAGRRWLPIGAARDHVAGYALADDTLDRCGEAGGVDAFGLRLGGSRTTRLWLIDRSGVAEPSPSGSGVATLASRSGRAKGDGRRTRRSRIRNTGRR